MRNRHLSDTRLVEMILAATPASADRAHLDACTACDARREEVVRLLKDIAQASTEETDAAFPEEKLTRQRLRIMQRIEAEGRPARVISFPGHQPHEKPALRAHSASRWVAAAAVAGLIVGIMAGRMSPLPSRLAFTPLSTQAPVGATPAAAFLPAVTLMSDEELLVHIELALDAQGGTALRPLDDLTPRLWEGP